MLTKFRQNNKGEKNNNQNINNNVCNILTNDAESELNNEDDAVQIMIKEEISKMKNECNKEQEKSKILEVENRIFEKIMRDYVIKANAIKKVLKE